MPACVQFVAPFKCGQFWVTHITTEITEHTERGKISVCSVISVVEKFIQCYLDLNGVEKTAPIYNSGLVFSKSNLGLSALANSRFFNLFGYVMPLEK